jgi:protein-disulfide isomerase
MSATAQKTLFFCCLSVLLHADTLFASWCDSLTDKKQKTATEALRSFYLPVCGNQPLESCMRDSLNCPPAPRLANFGCWLASGGKDAGYIREKLSSRYKGMTKERKYIIDQTLFPLAGESTAPVTITMYISISCPRCKQVSGFLYDSVTVGSLKGKAKLCIKLLTVNERDMALLAANECGRFWDYMHRISTISKRLDMPVLYEVAEKMHIPMTRFKKSIKDSTLLEKAHSSRKEAHANGVSVTPTLFINGHRYSSYTHPMWIADAVEYELQRMKTGDRKKP